MEERKKGIKEKMNEGRKNSRQTEIKKETKTEIMKDYTLAAEDPKQREST